LLRRLRGRIRRLLARLDDELIRRLLASRAQEIRRVAVRNTVDRSFVKRWRDKSDRRLKQITESENLTSCQGQSQQLELPLAREEPTPVEQP
jgi:hypothetical protein